MSDIDTRLKELLKEKVPNLLSDSDIKNLITTTIRDVLHKPKHNEVNTPIENLAIERLDKLITPVLDKWMQEHSTQILAMVEKTLNTEVEKIIQKAIMTWELDLLDSYEQEQDENLEPQELSFNKIVHETEMAILFQNDEGKFWIPKSTIIDYEFEGNLFVEDYVDIEYIPEK